MKRKWIKGLIVGLIMMLLIQIRALQFILNPDKDLMYTIADATQQNFPKLRIELLILRGADVKYKDLNTSTIELALYTKNMELLSLLTKNSSCLERLDFYKMAEQIYKEKELLLQIGRALKIKSGEDCLRPARQ